LTLFSTNPTNNRNAPISWIEKTLELYIDYSKPTKEALLSKILLGLPFHGVLIESSQDQPRMSIMDSSAFTNVVSSGQITELHWDEKESEHLVTLENEGSKSLALYPTKKFIKERIEFCKNKNLGGIAIWELSLGLESFLDEF
jgi:spore germination protein YaaH